MQSQKSLFNVLPELGTDKVSSFGLLMAWHFQPVSVIYQEEQ
jgi:hypothetical protein